jgi:hypothetical protein
MISAEIPLKLPKEILVITNPIRSQGTPQEEVLPPGYRNCVIEATETQFEKFTDWAAEQSDLKIIGITQLKPL